MTKRVTGLQNIVFEKPRRLRPPVALSPLSLAHIYRHRANEQSALAQRARSVIWYHRSVAARAKHTTGQQHRRETTSCAATAPEMALFRVTAAARLCETQVGKRTSDSRRRRRLVTEAAGVGLVGHPRSVRPERGAVETKEGGEAGNPESCT